MVSLGIMLLPFKQHLQHRFPEVFEARILVAVSGGIDSVVMAHLCRESGLDFALAHCNFNLRGEESNGDEDFVLELAESLDREVFIERFETESYAREKGISIQMAARDLRYHWFEELRETLEYEFVFTGHHANDNLETVLINLIRGTGLEGLTGIPERNDKIIRPLLPFPRKVIEEFAHSRKFRWREDSSNSSVKYLRNAIRHKIIPGMEQLNPQLLEGFEKTRRHLEGSARLLEDYISFIFPQVARQEDFGYSFDIAKLRQIPNTQAVLYELFRSFGFREWNDVYHLLEAQSGKIVYSATHRLIRDRERILLTSIDSKEAGEFEIAENEELLMLPAGTFHIDLVEEVTESAFNVIFVDKEKLRFPLRVRKWQRGDYFYPHGMQGKKKLSKYFKDEKFSLPEKENCWLLCSDDDIVWVINYRPDRRFTVDQGTKQILRITFSP